MKSIWKSLLLLLLFAAGTFWAYQWFEGSIYFSQFEDFLLQNTALTIVILILIKIVSIVWPPLSASLIIVAVIPVYGWVFAFVVDFIGELIGSSIAYAITYYHGEKLIKKFLPESTVASIMDVKIEKKREFEMLIVLRFIGWTFFEIVCYAAGLLRIDFKTYFISMLISYSITGVIIFKYAEVLLSGEASLPILLLVLVGIVLFSFVAKSRYIES